MTSGQGQNAQICESPVYSELQKQYVVMLLSHATSCTLHKIGLDMRPPHERWLGCRKNCGFFPYCAWDNALWPGIGAIFVTGGKILPIRSFTQPGLCLIPSFTLDEIGWVPILKFLSKFIHLTLYCGPWLFGLQFWNWTGAVVRRGRCTRQWAFADIGINGRSRFPFVTRSVVCGTGM